MSTRLRSATLLLMLALAACSAAPSAQERVESTEQSALAPLKSKYPSVVTAFDISGTRLDLAIDATVAWQNAWRKAHPHQHATLMLRFRDFMSRTWYKQTVQA